MDILCWECGKVAHRTRITEYDGISYTEKPISIWSRCYCEECKARLDKQEKEDMELYIKLKKKEMFLKACNLLEKQETKMYKYKDAIDVVREHLEKNPDKYDSSYEVLAAIILVHNRIYAKMQYKVGKYQVDFLLPELLVVLEIDGERHKHRKEYDTKRDIYIQNALGEGWDIVRIKTDYLDMNAKKLPKAIEKVIDYRQTGKVNWRAL